MQGEGLRESKELYRVSSGVRTWAIPLQLELAMPRPQLPAAYVCCHLKIRNPMLPGMATFILGLPVRHSVSQMQQLVMVPSAHARTF